MSYRINIEGRFWDDSRYLTLRGKITERRAIGACVEAWRLAQAFWLQGKLIPEHVWKSLRLCNDLFDVGLAERQDGGVYMKGSRDSFSFLVSRVENGRKGGRPAKPQPEIDLPNKINDVPKPTNNQQPKLELTEHKASLSVSESISESKEKNTSAVAELPLTPMSPELENIVEVRAVLLEWKVPPKTQQAWLDLYKNKAWVAEQVLKAHAWVLSNPQKAPKSSHARFLNNWLTRGWEDHRKRLPSNPAANRPEQTDLNLLKKQLTEGSSLEPQS